MSIDWGGRAMFWGEGVGTRDGDVVGGTVLGPSNCTGYQ